MYGYYNFLNVLKNIIGELCDFFSFKDISLYIYICMLYFLVFVIFRFYSGIYFEDCYF